MNGGRICFDSKSFEQMKVEHPKGLVDQFKDIVPTLIYGGFLGLIVVLLGIYVIWPVLFPPKEPETQLPSLSDGAGYVCDRDSTTIFSEDHDQTYSLIRESPCEFSCPNGWLSVDFKTHTECVPPVIGKLSGSNGTKILSGDIDIPTGLLECTQLTAAIELPKNTSTSSAFVETSIWAENFLLAKIAVESVDKNNLVLRDSLPFDVNNANVRLFRGSSCQCPSDLPESNNDRLQWMLNCPTYDWPDCSDGETSISQINSHEFENELRGVDLNRCTNFCHERYLSTNRDGCCEQYFAEIDGVSQTVCSWKQTPYGQMSTKNPTKNYEVMSGPLKMFGFENSKMCGGNEGTIAYNTAYITNDEFYNQVHSIPISVDECYDACSKQSNLSEGCCGWWLSSDGSKGACTYNGGIYNKEKQSFYTTSLSPSVISSNIDGTSLAGFVFAGREEDPTTRRSDLSEQHNVNINDNYAVDVPFI